MKKFQLIFFLVFGLIGSGLLVGACFAISSTLSFRSNTKRADGVVVELSWSGGSATPVVQWTDAKGGVHKVVGGVSSKPPSYSVGEKVDVRYDPAQPDRARIDGFLENWFAALILGILGTVFFSIGAGFGLFMWRSKRNREWLQANGTRIQAKFMGVMIDTSIRMNGQSPRRLTAQWQNPSTSEIHTFKSEALWFDPSEFVKGETIEVLINQERPSMYWIDISFLPKQAG